MTTTINTAKNDKFVPDLCSGSNIRQRRQFLVLIFFICLSGTAYSQRREAPKVVQAPAGEMIVRQVKDNLLFLDIPSNRLLYRIPLPANDEFRLLAFNPSGTLLILSGRRRNTVVYRVSRDTAEKTADLPFRTASVAFSHSGKKVYLLHSKNVLKGRLAVYDAQTWKRLGQKTLTAVSGDIEINANDSLIAFPSVGTVKTNNAEDLKVEKVYWQRAAQKIIVFNPVVQQECASTTRENVIQIIDLQKDSILTEIKKHDAAVVALGYRPDGGQLFSLDKSGKLCVWSLKERTLVAELENVHDMPFWDSVGNLRTAASKVALPDKGSDHRNFQQYKEPSSEVFFSPSFGYAPETGITPGLGVIKLIQPANKSNYYRPSIGMASVSYGIDGNQVLAKLSVNSYIKDKWHIQTDVEYDAHGKNYFFGIGEDAGRKNKRSYFSNNFSLNGSLCRMTGAQLGAGIGYDIRHNTRADFNKTIQDLPPGAKGGLLIGAGPIFRLDSRNDILSPRMGQVVDLSFLRYGLCQAGDYRFNRIKIDYRKYFPLGSPAEDRLIAVQAMADITWGDDVPFYSLPYFTGDRAFRGIYRNLYLDKQVVFLQAEFRSLFTQADPRYGYAIFAGAGDGRADLFHGYSPDLKMVYGLGFRQQLFPKNRLLLRLDVAFTSKGDFGVFAGMGASF